MYVCYIEIIGWFVASEHIKMHFIENQIEFSLLIINNGTFLSHSASVIHLFNVYCYRKIVFRLSPCSVFSLYSIGRTGETVSDWKCLFLLPRPQSGVRRRPCSSWKGKQAEASSPRTQTPQKEER